VGEEATAQRLLSDHVHHGEQDTARG
jgi:hypothetical protein